MSVTRSGQGTCHEAKDRRRRVLIDDLQYRLLKVNVSYFFLILLIFISALFVPLVVQLLGSEASSFAREEAATKFLWLQDEVWLPVLWTFFCLGAHSILVSHRIAGPLYQLRRVLGAVGDGNFAVRAVLRDKDYLRKEEAVVNEMIVKLGTRIAEIDEYAAQIQAQLSGLRTAIDARETGEALETLGSVDEQFDSLSAVLNEFDTGDEDQDEGLPTPAPATAHAS